VNWVDLWGLEVYSYEVSQTLNGTPIGPLYILPQTTYSATYYSTDRELLEEFKTAQENNPNNLPWAGAPGTGLRPTSGDITSSGSVPPGLDQELDQFLEMHNGKIVEYYKATGVAGKKSERNYITKDDIRGRWDRYSW
jgi:hypothetical protein